MKETDGKKWEAVLRGVEGKIGALGGRGGEGADNGGVEERVGVAEELRVAVNTLPQP